MVKLTVLYQRLTDVDSFVQHYRATHAGLAAALPGLQRFEYGPCLPGADGSHAPYGWVAELWFADANALGAALGSAEGKAAAEDVAALVPFCEGPPSTFVSDVVGTAGGS